MKGQSFGSRSTQALSVQTPAEQGEEVEIETEVR